MAETESWAREKAVDVHNKTAPYFVTEYADPTAHFDSDFRYGRKLIDERWRDTAEAALAGEGAEALDIGCGIGVHLSRLLAMGKQAAGIEPSAEMREQAVAALGPERVRDGSVLALDFEDDRFAFAYAIEVFRYLDAADNATGHAEIARVLRPGGVYYGTYVNRFALDGFRQLTLVRRLRHRLGGAEPACHVEFETPASIRSKLLAAGFSEVQVIGAMLAPLRILYKIAPGLAARLAPAISRREEVLSNTGLTRALAGHMIAIARK